MMAPSKGRRVAKKYYGAVDARVTKLRNDDHDYTELTHYGRADQKLNQEWHVIYGQPRLSGDDMSTLQVGPHGRPALFRDTTVTVDFTELAMG